MNMNDRIEKDIERFYNIILESIFCDIKNSYFRLLV